MWTKADRGRDIASSNWLAFSENFSWEGRVSTSHFATNFFLKTGDK